MPALNFGKTSLHPALTRLLAFVLIVLVGLLTVFPPVQGYKENETKNSYLQSILEEDKLGTERRNSLKLHSQKNAVYQPQFKPFLSLTKRYIQHTHDLSVICPQQQPLLIIVRGPPETTEYPILSHI